MKKIIVILLVLLLILQYKIWLGDAGVPEILHLQDQVDSEQIQVDRLKERNSSLEAEVNDLKTGLDAIEERARSELGMIRNNETYYQVIERQPSANE